MKGEEFFNAINMIDDDLVQEAAFIRKRKRNKKSVFFTFAACLAVFICTGVILSEFGLLSSYETADDVAQGTGTKNEIAENVLVGDTDNMFPESGSAQDSTGAAYEKQEPEAPTVIYIPETAPTEVYVSGASGENTGSKGEGTVESATAEGSSTPPYEAVTGEDVSYPPMSEETTTGKTQEYNGNSTMFKAKIIEINGNSVMVEPLDSVVSSSSDRIVFSNVRLEELDVKKGDVVIIVYDGLIMESYPAQICASSWSLAQ